VDAEFGRAIASLERAGVLGHAHLFVTSDHGEMFERGVFGHFTPLLYEPVIHVPLLVSVPGASSRLDVRVPTSNVDILPTVVGLAGTPTGEWCEGRALPGLGGIEDTHRSIFATEAKRNPANSPLRTALWRAAGAQAVHYAGYSGRYQQHTEFYDLENDPDEMTDLADRAKGSGELASMQSELQDRIAAADRSLPG
jgi:arylsulfatase A-like enzyme